MKKSKLFKTIYKFYEEYKIFINSATLPDIKSEIIDQKTDTLKVRLITARCNLK